HSLQYFSDNWKQFDYDASDLGPYPADITDSARSRLVGNINGFTIYEVVHETSGSKSNGEFVPTLIKMILVEHRPDEFCEIFNEEDFAGRDLVDVGPAYIVDVDSVKFLATHDQINGSCGCYNEAYWSFDKDGPIFLDLSGIEPTARRLLPGDVDRRNEV